MKTRKNIFDKLVRETKQIISMTQKFIKSVPQLASKQARINRTTEVGAYKRDVCRI